MELRHLRYFLAAAETGGFGAAARVRRVAQPALSRQIRDLEAELGVALFERAGRGVRLSAAGRAFAVHVRRILDDIERAGVELRRVARGEVGRLRVGFLESAAWGGVLPRLLQRFRAEVPEVELQLHAASTLEQRPAIQSGALDCGVVYLQGDALDDAFARARLRVDRVIAALPAAHPLAGRRRLRLAQLADQPFVSFPRAAAPLYWDRLMRACAAGRMVPRVVQEAVGDSVQLSLVGAGIGVALVNSVARLRKPEGVALVDIQDLDVALPLDLVWRRDDTAAPLVRFVALARALAARPG